MAIQDQDPMAGAADGAAGFSRVGARSPTRALGAWGWPLVVLKVLVLVGFAIAGKAAQLIRVRPIQAHRHGK